jgi:beta-lactamase regulating signal transducer with metallopeptidase domain
MKMEMWQLPAPIAEALTFTLLHSLWQGLVILLLLKSGLALIPQQRSVLRYGTTAVSLVILLATTILTFFVIYDPVVVKPGASAAVVFAGSQNATINEPVTTQLSAAIAQYRDYILLAWAIGCAFFMMRLSAGYLYLQNIKRTSVPVLNEWKGRIEILSRKLRLTTTVVLAESARVYTPLVIGFVKPFIVLPAGLISGLNAEQVEAILMHELMHIRRNDFLLNLFQSLLEALLFFNPFVWMISSILRTEREHCCDDAVIINGANTKAYVKALAALEESRSTSTLALSFAGNKNQLLERIKRIMEKSVKNYSLKEKAVPVVFLFVGLVCASWFSIQKGTDQVQKMSEDKLVAADTSIRKKQKTASYSRKKTTVVAPDGKPKEEIVERYDGDEDLWPMMDDMASMHLAVPPLPEFHFPPMPDFPDMAAFEGIPPFPDMILSLDTIPPHRVGPRDWSAFEKEFTERFQEKFGDFYEKNQGEFQRMMEEFQQKFSQNEEALMRMNEMSMIGADHMAHQALAMAEQAKQMREQGEHMRQFESQMRDWENENHERMKALGENMKRLEEKMKAFSAKLKKELVRDGYLKESDEIREMRWDDDGDIEVNDFKIREGDLKKYRELHKEFFGDSHGRFHYSE